MKTLLLIALTFVGISFAAPQAEARDRYRSRGDDCRQDRYYGSSYRWSGYRSYSAPRYYRPSYRYSYYRSDCAPRYRSYSYHRPSRYYYSERRHYVRPPLLSFVFGF